jgi:Arc/MetJ-type ribon-helix-helix transcriptional regulator
MKRTTVSLPDDLADALGREAHRRHSSASEVTREALQAHLGLQPGRVRTLPFAAVGHSGGGTIARDMEQELEREWDEHDPGGR